MIALPINLGTKNQDYLFKCEELYREYEHQLQYMSGKEFCITLNRMSALLDILNCGIEFTTITQLNAVSRF